MKMTYEVPIIFEFEVEVEDDHDLANTEGMLPQLTESLLANLNISDETNDMFTDSLVENICGDLTGWKFRLERGEES